MHEEKGVWCNEVIRLKGNSNLKKRESKKREAQTTNFFLMTFACSPDFLPNCMKISSWTQNASSPQLTFFTVKDAISHERCLHPCAFLSRSSKKPFYSFVFNSICIGWIRYLWGNNINTAEIFSGQKLSFISKSFASFLDTFLALKNMLFWPKSVIQSII